MNEKTGFRRGNNTGLGLIIVFASIVSIGIAYAGFTGTLNINGNATVKSAKWDIYFDNLSNATLTGTANLTEAATIQSKTTIGDYEVTFASPGDSLTYTFDVVNDGNFDATLISLTKTSPSCLPSSSVCNYITYTLRYTDSNRDVSENDSLLKGETRNLTLKLILNSDIPASALPSSDTIVSDLGITLLYSQASGYNGGNSTAFHPEGVYNITYTNISGDYPIQGYTNETLEIDFSGTKYNLIELYQGNTKLSPILNYTFENQILSIFNVSDDIEIIYIGNFCTENNLTKLNDCIIARDVNEPNVATAKTLIAAKTSPDFTTVEPSISYVQKIEIGLSSANSIASTTYGEIYFGTGTPTFDSEKGEWSFTRTHTGSIPDYLSDNNTKYYTCLSDWRTTCDTIYVVYNYRTKTNTNTGVITYYITNADKYTYQISNNSSANNGIYKTTDDYGDTYYYRGIVNNNFVKFGQNSSNQDLYWRIVRVNGDNSIRLIYNGTNTNQTGTSTQIGTSAFNSYYYDPAMIGYTYRLDQEYKETTNAPALSGIGANTNYVFGTTLDCTDTTNKLCTVGGSTITNTWYNFAKSWNGTTPYYTCFGIGTSEGHGSTTCSIAMQIVGTVASGSDINKTQARVKYKGYLSKTYEGITNPIGSQTKDTDSTIKIAIDTWYENNIKNTVYENYLVDNIFCNDRSIYSGTGQDLSASTYYASYRRSRKSGTNWPSYAPLLSCPRQIDEYTVSVDSTNNRGNGKLDYPIGLLTADELRAAGSVYSLKNNYYYLYSEKRFWLISPAVISTSRYFPYTWFMNETGGIEDGYSSSPLGVRPVININKNVTITGGNGSASSPFTITLN